MTSPDRIALIRTSNKAHYIKNAKIRKGLLVVCSLAVFASMVLGGYYVASKLRQEDISEDDSTPEEIAYDKIINEIQPEKIKENLRYLTHQPHIAGSQGNLEVVSHLKSFYENAGFDRVDIYEYEVLLSYPKEAGFISMSDSTTESTIFETKVKEKILWKGEGAPNAVYPFNAYSPSGDVKGKLIYVNYGTPKDFELLSKMGIDLTGCIAIAKYGVNYRGNKMELARKAGALGLLLYGDPTNYAQDKSAYPHNWWLPDDGVQRGGVRSADGDPLTPGYPAVDGIYRISLEKANLPSIPVQPISYHDALQLLKHLDGVKAPDSWQGGLNLTYRISTKKGNTKFVRLVVNNELKMKKIHNVIATLKGGVEPDRSVLLGNHHDAWIFGGGDPSSGTAVMMEIGRVLGKTKESGWRPRRTIKICAWDAEEFGLIGSTEWVEENADLLLYEAVAYINVDKAIGGNYTIMAKASPQIPDTLFRAAQRVKDPDEASESLFNTWRRKTPDREDKEKPRLRLPSASSDYQAFYSRIGIPTVDLSYTYNRASMHSISSYPLYHSLHDTFHYMATFMDKDFSHHATLAALVLTTGLQVADTTIIPFNYSSYAYTLQKCYGESLVYQKDLEKRSISMEPLKKAIDVFSEAAKRFHETIENMDTKNHLRVRMVNDRIMHIGRAFVAPEGLPGRPLERHVIYAPSAHDSYKGTCFPGFTDSVFDLLQNGSKDWSIAAKQLSKVLYYIQQATILLEFK